MDSNWIAIGHIDDIPLRGARCVKTPEGKIAVFRTPKTRSRHRGSMPAQRRALSQGIVHGKSVTCPLHNW